MDGLSGRAVRRIDVDCRRIIENACSAHDSQLLNVGYPPMCAEADVAHKIKCLPRISGRFHEGLCSWWLSRWRYAFSVSVPWSTISLSYPPFEVVRWNDGNASSRWHFEHEPNTSNDNECIVRRVRRLPFTFLICVDVCMRPRSTRWHVNAREHDDRPTTRRVAGTSQHVCTAEVKIMYSTRFSLRRWQDARSTSIDK